jgi:hypothetical protein
LTFNHARPGFFRFNEETRTVKLPTGETALLVARNAEHLIDATSFHFEIGGFRDEAAARAHGERLRLCLQVLNAALVLGLTVPTVDTTSGGVSAEVKEQVAKDHGVTALDTIVGLAVFADDGKHAEYVFAGKMEAYPSDPEYLLTALAAVWPLELKIGDNERDALEIVGRATSELSPLNRFLLTYLALERVLKPGERSHAAKDLLKTFVEMAEAKLTAAEASSLRGGLTAMARHSVSSAFRDLAERIANPKEIAGTSIPQFAAECIQARNAIAHDGSVMDTARLNELSDNLRKLVLSLIWSDNKLPGFTVNVPQTKLAVTEIKILVK